MKLTPKKVIIMTLFLFVFTIIISCAKDTDLLLSSVLNDPEISLEEAAMNEELVDGDLVTRTFTFSPTNDAYIQNNLGYNKSIIRLEEDTRTSYLMFDLSQVNGTITDAVLQFSIDSDEGDGTIAVHKGSATDWTEENLNSTNVPNTEAQLGITNKAYKIGSPEKVILDPNNLSAEITTLVLTHNSGNDLAFASKEHPANKGPKLIIVYSAPAESPLIEQEPDNAEEENTTQEEAVTPPTVTSEEDTAAPEETTPQNNPTPSEEPSTTSAATEGAYYVTTSGNANNNGLSEATAWSIDHAFEIATAGDIVYIQAGSYDINELRIDNSGSINKPIKFIGYMNTPGDINSNNGSTFHYGDQLSPNTMPLIRGNSNLSGVGVFSDENYIELNNLQITNYQFGIATRGFHTVLKNIIISNCGEQNNDNSNTGKGIHIYGNNSTVENCFVLNANSEGINLKGASNCKILNTSVYSDNIPNPTGYYILISGGGKNNTVDKCTIYRDKDADIHRGHGFVIKDLGSENTFKNSKSYNTGIEVNFSGVSNNIFENIEIFGSNSEDSTEFTSNIRILNGAHNNLFKDITIEDCRYAINFHDFDDGFVAEDSDRDKKEGGSNNKFIRLKVDLAKNIIGATSKEGGASTFSNNNEFEDCSFTNVTSAPFFSYHNILNTKFSNCIFNDIPETLLITELNGGNFPIKFENCKFNNVGFTPPN